MQAAAATADWGAVTARTAGDVSVSAAEGSRTGAGGVSAAEGNDAVVRAGVSSWADGPRGSSSVLRCPL